MRVQVKRITFASLILAATVVLAAACSPTASPTTAAVPTQPGSGATAAIPPAQRANMYKTAPPMTIDVNKNIRQPLKPTKATSSLTCSRKMRPCTSTILSFWRATVSMMA